MAVTKERVQEQAKDLLYPFKCLDFFINAIYSVLSSIQTLDFFVATVGQNLNRYIGGDADIECIPDQAFWC